MKLHGYWRSSAAYRVRIALGLKGISYQTLAHSLPKGEHRLTAYRDLNPQGLVPLLETEAGAFSQSMAIMEYLNEVHPDPPFLPADRGARAVVRGMAAIISADIHPINNLRVLGRLRTQYGADEADLGEWVNHWIREGFSALETHARRFSDGGRHCYGDQVTLADICLVPQMYNARRYGCDLGDFPLLVDIDGYCRHLAAFRQAEPEVQPDAVLS